MTWEELDIELEKIGFIKSIHKDFDFWKFSDKCNEWIISHKRKENSYIVAVTLVLSPYNDIVVSNHELMNNYGYILKHAKYLVKRFHELIEAQKENIIKKIS